MDKNKKGNKRGLHWARKRAEKEAALAAAAQAPAPEAPPETPPENPPVTYDTIFNNEPLVEHELTGDIPKLEDPREYIEQQEQAEQSSAASDDDDAARPEIPASQVSQVSVDICVNITSVLASKIPPDNRGFSPEEEKAWSSVWRHTLARFGYDSLPLWMEWVGVLSSSFLPRIIKWKNHKPAPPTGGQPFIDPTEEPPRPPPKKTPLDALYKTFGL